MKHSILRLLLIAVLFVVVAAFTKEGWKSFSFSFCIDREEFSPLTDFV